MKSGSVRKLLDWRQEASETKAIPQALQSYGHNNLHLKLLLVVFSERELNRKSSQMFFLTPMRSVQTHSSILRLLNFVSLFPWLPQCHR